MESPFIWMLRFDYTPLFWMVNDALRHYNRMLYFTMKQLRRKPGSLRANATSYRGNFEKEGWDLIQRAEKNAFPTREEMRELAHEIAVYMSNSPDVRKFVIDYWNLRSNLIQCHIYALKMAGQMSRGPDHVIIEQKIDRLEEKKGYARANYSKSCALLVPVVKKEIIWPDTDAEESSNADFETSVPVVPKEIIVVDDKDSDSSEEIVESDKSSESSDPIADDDELDAAEIANRGLDAEFAKAHKRDRSPVRT
jgi:hypothetical protein